MLLEVFFPHLTFMKSIVRNYWTANEIFFISSDYSLIDYVGKAPTPERTSNKLVLELLPIFCQFWLKKKKIFSF